MTQKLTGHARDRIKLGKLMCDIGTGQVPEIADNGKSEEAAKHGHAGRRSRAHNLASEQHVEIANNASKFSSTALKDVLIWLVSTPATSSAPVPCSGLRRVGPRTRRERSQREPRTIRTLSRSTLCYKIISSLVTRSNHACNGR
jgi:hypothetical protein